MRIPQSSNFVRPPIDSGSELSDAEEALLGDEEQRDNWEGRVLVKGDQKQ